jgi:hypothetical protein
MKAVFFEGGGLFCFHFAVNTTEESSFLYRLERFCSGDGFGDSSEAQIPFGNDKRRTGRTSKEAASDSGVTGKGGTELCRQPLDTDSLRKPLEPAS